jgi:hypothetical protein
MPSRAARGCHVQRLGQGVSQPCPGAPAQWFVAWQPSASPSPGGRPPREGQIGTITLLQAPDARGAIATVAAANKCLAQINKSGTGHEATKKRNHQ